MTAESVTEVSSPRTHDQDPRSTYTIHPLPLLEVAGVGAAAFASIWIIIPWGGTPAFIACVIVLLAMMVGSNLYHRDGWAGIGLRRDTLVKAAKETALFTVPAAAAMLAIGSYLGGVRWGWPMLVSCLAYPVWGLIQQYLFQGFCYNRVEDGVAHRWAAVVITACFYSAVHAPNLALMAFTLFSGLVWSYLFSRTRNILPLGVSHGVLASVLLYSAPGWILPSLVIGPRFWER